MYSVASIELMSDGAFRGTSFTLITFKPPAEPAEAAPRQGRRHEQENDIHKPRLLRPDERIRLTLGCG